MSTQENGQQRSAPEQEVLLNISALSELEDSGIEGAEMAQRRVNEEYAQELSQSDDSRWPPILVGQLEGQAMKIILDGYQRVAAMTYKHKDVIRAVVRTFKDEQDLVEAAFQANIR